MSTYSVHARVSTVIAQRSMYISCVCIASITPFLTPRYHQHARITGIPERWCITGYSWSTNIHHTCSCTNESLLNTVIVDIGIYRLRPFGAYAGNTRTYSTYLCSVYCYGVLYCSQDAMEHHTLSNRESSITPYHGVELLVYISSVFTRARACDYILFYVSTAYTHPTVQTAYTLHPHIGYCDGIPYIQSMCVY